MEAKEPGYLLQQPSRSMRRRTVTTIVDRLYSTSRLPINSDRQIRHPSIPQVLQPPLSARRGTTGHICSIKMDSIMKTTHRAIKWLTMASCIWKAIRFFTTTWVPRSHLRTSWAMDSNNRHPSNNTKTKEILSRETVFSPNTL